MGWSFAISVEGCQFNWGRGQKVLQSKVRDKESEAPVLLAAVGRRTNDSRPNGGHQQTANKPPTAVDDCRCTGNPKAQSSSEQCMGCVPRANVMKERSSNSPHRHKSPPPPKSSASGTYNALGVHRGSG